MLTITRVDAIPVSLRLRKPILMGGGQRFERSETLVVRIQTRGGLAGWGEAASAIAFTGEDLPGMVDTVRHVLAPALVGQDARQRIPLERRLDGLIARRTGAKSACNMALLDLLGRHLDVPACELLGGAVRDRVDVMCLLANPTAEEDLQEALALCAAGFRTFKLKAGVKPLPDEVGLLRTLRDRCGAAARLCADANASMSAEAARAYVAKAEEVDLLFLEQPFADDQLEATRELARRTRVPLCADEAAHSLADVLHWHAEGAIAGANLKSIKFAGPAGVMRAAIVCDALGLQVNLAAKTGESSIGNAALLHLAYTVPGLAWSVTPVSTALAEDLVMAPLVAVAGSMALPAGPGLGVVVDPKAVASSATERGVPVFDN